MKFQNVSRHTTMLATLAGALVGLAAAAATAQPIAIQAQQVLGGLVQPVGVYAPPGDTSRIFILQQSGQILLYDLATNSLVGTYLDLGPTGLNLVTTVTGGTERGLLGLAFHPDFANNGFFYVNYTSRTTGATVVRRYTASAPFATSTTANTGSGSDIIIVAQDFANHNGGSIRFGPDNMLYVFMGDGGSANDPNNRAQDDTQLLGKILRLDVNDTSAGDGDGAFVPDNNPYRALGNPRDKVWSKGMRNPWRSTFDRLTGDMWVADVGQDAREEVNFQPAVQLQNPANGNSTILNAAAVAGLNYGWDCREGLIACPTGLATQGCDPNGGPYFNPITDYTHANPALGCSITGGYVYRGSAIPALQGLYIYADYCTATTHRVLGYNGSAITFHADIAEQLRIGTGLLTNITSYGEDGAGELYVCVSPANGSAGTVYKIVPFATPCGCPCVATGAQRTLFSDRFETNLGWTVASDTSLTDGPWTRGRVVNDLTWQYDPIQDFDGNDWAFVTDNAAGNSDVDAGSTRVTSPALDFSLGQITICYSYFLKMNAPDSNDGLYVEVSSNGAAGPWIRVRSYQADMSTRWMPDTITQSQLDAAGVTSNANMRIRFVATDDGAGNIVEAGIDDFKILTANVPDCNENGVDDLADISSGTSLDANGNQIPDECEGPDCPCDWDNNGEIGVPDIFAFLSSWFAMDPAADFNGTNGVDVPDIFAFLSCWFANCP